MEMLPHTSEFTNKGFTLLEVLVVLILVSLIFSVVLTVVKGIGGGALELKNQAEELKNNIYLSFRIKQQLESLYRNLALEQREDGLYLGFVTASGEVYRGIVKVRYRFSDGKLFYCESLYTYNDLLSCENGHEYFLTKLNNFKVRIFYRGKWFEGKNFYGQPEKIEVYINKYRIITKVHVGRRMRL